MAKDSKQGQVTSSTPGKMDNKLVETVVIDGKVVPDPNSPASGVQR